MYCYGDSKALTATVFPSTHRVEGCQTPTSEICETSLVRVSPDSVDSKVWRKSTKQTGSVKGALEVWGCLGHDSFEILKFSDEFKRIPNRPQPKSSN